MGIKFLGKSSFVDLALVVGSTKFQGNGEKMELGPNKWPGSHALQAASLGSSSMCSASSRAAGARKKKLWVVVAVCTC